MENILVNDIIVIKKLDINFGDKLYFMDSNKIKFAYVSSIYYKINTTSEESKVNRSIEITDRVGYGRTIGEETLGITYFRSREDCVNSL